MGSCCFLQEPLLSPNHAALKGVADLLLLQQRLRRAQTLPELESLVVNESRLLLGYRIAILWRGRRLVALSGLAKPEPSAPFSHWANRLVRHLHRQKLAEPQLIQADQLPEPLAAEWSDYLPPYGLLLPLRHAEEEPMGMLLLLQSEPWREEAQRLGHHWSDAVAHALYALELHHRYGRRHRWHQRLYHWRGGAVVVLLGGLALLPVPLSLLAPAEIVPIEPWVVRSPLDGVVEEIAVTPHQRVAVGDLLLRLNDTALLSRLEVARQELEIARAEQLRAAQAAVMDREASARLPVLEARIAQRSSEVAYVESLLQRIEIRAERSGIAIIPQLNELEGRAVTLGERLLTLADPDAVAVEFWLPVGDSLNLPPQTPLRLYLNSAPTAPLDGVVERIDYQAEISTEGLLAYRGRAQLNPLDGQSRTLGQEPPRIGLRGTARLTTAEVPLYYYLFRRPYAALRQMVGF